MNTTTKHIENFHDPWQDYLHCDLCREIINAKLEKLNDREDTLEKVAVPDVDMTVQF